MAACLQERGAADREHMKSRLTDTVQESYNDRPEKYVVNDADCPSPGEKASSEFNFAMQAYLAFY